MKYINRVWQIVVVGVVALAMARMPLARATTSTVEFDYNGIRWTSQTTARDVSEALIESLGDYSHLLVTPTPDTPITGHTIISISDIQPQSLDVAVSKNLKLTVAAQEAEEKAKEEAEKEAAKPKPTPTKIPAGTSLPDASPKPTPTATDIHSGLATWYRHGDGLTTASRDFPKGTKLRVIAVNSGRSVDVEVNDYGPSAATGIALDLNLPAFEALAPAGAGKIQVKYHKL